MSQGQFPSTAPTGGAMRPHRGTMILVFGILGLVLCIIFAILAWVMGGADLKEMDAGRMDPSGRGMTQAGKILGIVGVVLNLIVIVGWVLVMVVGIGAAAAGAAGAGGP